MYVEATAGTYPGHMVVGEEPGDGDGRYFGFALILPICRMDFGRRTSGASISCKLPCPDRLLTNLPM